MGANHDKEIREPLFEFLEETYGKIRILEEKMMGRSRADAVMVLEDALCGIEIKSDTDTYTRLATQVRDYDRYFDYNIVVAGSSHALHIEEHVPDYWGIITVDGNAETPDFYILRAPRKNPKAVFANKFSILWRPELAKLQEKYMLPAYKAKSKAFVQAALLAAVPEEVLHKEISEMLFERDYSKIKEEIETFRQEMKAKRKRKYTGKIGAKRYRRRSKKTER